MARRDLNRRLDRLERKSGSGLTVIFKTKGESDAEARRRYETQLGRAIEGVAVYLDWKDAAA